MSNLDAYENGYQIGVSFAYIPDDLTKDELRVWGIGYRDGKEGHHKTPDK